MKESDDNSRACDLSSGLGGTIPWEGKSREGGDEEFREKKRDFALGILC